MVKCPPECSTHFQKGREKVLSGAARYVDRTLRRLGWRYLDTRCVIF